MFLAPEIAVGALARELLQYRTTIALPQRGRPNEALAMAARNIVSSGQTRYDESLSGASGRDHVVRPHNNPRTLAWLEQLANFEATPATSMAVNPGQGPRASESSPERIPTSRTSATFAEVVSTAAQEQAEGFTAHTGSTGDDDDSDESKYELRLDATDALLAHGSKACSEQDWVTAEAFLQNTVDMLPQLPARLRDRYDLLSLRYQIALCAFHLYDADTAEKPLQSVVKRGSQTKEQAVNLCEAGSMLSQVYIKQGRLDAARSACESACKVLKKYAGKDHQLYQASLALLSRIYELQNEPRLAKVYGEMIPAEMHKTLTEPYASLSPLTSPTITSSGRFSERTAPSLSTDLTSLRSAETSRIDPSTHAIQFQPYADMPDVVPTTSTSGSHQSRAANSLKSVKQLRVLKRPTNHGHVSTLAFAPSRRLRASSITQSTVNFWQTYEWTQATSVALKGHQNCVQATAFSPDGELLASVAADKTARLWNLATEQEVQSLTHEEAVYAVTFSPDSKRLATGSAGGAVRLWDLDTGDSRHGSRSGDRVDCVTFAPDGRSLASRASDGMITVWDIEKVEPLHTFGHASSKRDDTDLSRHRLLYSPDGRCLASWGSDAPALSLWDPASGAKFRDLDHRKGKGARDVIFVPGSRLLLSASSDERTRIWDIDADKKIQRLDRIVESLAVSSDGQLLAMSLHWEKKIILYELSYHANATFQRRNTPSQNKMQLGAKDRQADVD